MPGQDGDQEQFCGVVHGDPPGARAARGVSLGRVEYEAVRDVVGHCVPRLMSDHIKHRPRPSVDLLCVESRPKRCSGAACQGADVTGTPAIVTSTSWKSSMKFAMFAALVEPIATSCISSVPMWSSV